LEEEMGEGGRGEQEEVGTELKAGKRRREEEKERGGGE
jgi:hypothetical protein